MRKLSSSSCSLKLFTVFSFSVANADIALCVLSISDVLRASASSTDSEALEIQHPSELSPLISSDNTFLLLNKSDLLRDLDPTLLQTLAKRAGRALGIPKAWVVSLDTSAGTDEFLSDLSTILRQRSASWPLPIAQLIAVT